MFDKKKGKRKKVEMDVARFKELIQEKRCNSVDKLIMSEIQLMNFEIYRVIGVRKTDGRQSIELLFEGENSNRAIGIQELLDKIYKLLAGCNLKEYDIIAKHFNTDELSSEILNIHSCEDGSVEITI